MQYDSEGAMAVLQGRIAEAAVLYEQVMERDRDLRTNPRLLRSKQKGTTGDSAALGGLEGMDMMDTVDPNPSGF